jgi:adenine phosphoribosyltransferase
VTPSTAPSAARLATLIADVPDFPVPGVAFKDITPLLASPGGFSTAVEVMVGAAPPDVDVVVGLEARGFIFAAPVALALGVGFVPARKPGKLPRTVVSVDYTLEYATTALAVHADAIRPGARVLLIDDVLATGGTAAAAAELIGRLGGHLVQTSVVVELAFLNGREQLRQHGVDQIHSLVRVEHP